MKRLISVLGALALAALSTAAFATTATSFSSFQGKEEPTVRYNPATGAFTNDSYDNMTSPSSGSFKFYLRWSSTGWDGDRATTSTDRQRAEVRGLGTNQKTN